MKNKFWTVGMHGETLVWLLPKGPTRRAVDSKWIPDFGRSWEVEQFRTRREAEAWIFIESIRRFNGTAETAMSYVDKPYFVVRVTTGTVHEMQVKPITQEVTT